jgi:hypothetical protein
MQSTSYSLRSTNTSNLFIPKPNSSFMKRTLHYSGTILWNALTSNLKTVKKCSSIRNIMNILYLQQEHD